MVGGRSPLWVGLPLFKPGDPATVASGRSLTGNGLAPLDCALADATVKRTRDCLLPHKRKGVVRLVGLQRASSARWAVVEH